MSSPSEAQVMKSQLVGSELDVGSVEGLKLQLEKSRHETEDLSLQLEVSRRELGMVHELQMQLALSRRDAARTKDMQIQLDNVRREAQQLKDQVGGTERKEEATLGEVHKLRAQLGEAEEAATGAKFESERLRAEVDSLRQQQADPRQDSRSSVASVVSFATPDVAEFSPPESLRSPRPRSLPTESLQSPRGVRQDSSQELSAAASGVISNGQRRTTALNLREPPSVNRSSSSAHSNFVPLDSPSQSLQSPRVQESVARSPFGSASSSASGHQRTSALNGVEPSAAHRVVNSTPSDGMIEGSQFDSLLSSTPLSHYADGQRAATSEKEALASRSFDTSVAGFANGQRRTTALNGREPPSPVRRCVTTTEGDRMTEASQFQTVCSSPPQTSSPDSRQRLTSGREDLALTPGDKSVVNIANGQQQTTAFNAREPSSSVGQVSNKGSDESMQVLDAPGNWPESTISKENGRTSACSAVTVSRHSGMAPGSLDRAVGSTLGAVAGLQEHAGLLRALVELKEQPTEDIVRDTWQFAREIERANRQWYSIRGVSELSETPPSASGSSISIANGQRRTTALDMREPPSVAQRPGSGGTTPLCNVISGVGEVEPQVKALAAQLWGWDSGKKPSVR